jgi:hypothetical protein
MKGHLEFLAISSKLIVIPLHVIPLHDKAKYVSLSNDSA